MTQDTSLTPEQIAALRADREFQERLDATPLVCDDDGVARVRVGRAYYTTVQGQLVTAPIPADLSRPAVWESATSDDPSARKARSMLGLT